MSRTDRAPGSFAAYRTHVERHLIPAFGERRLDQITPEIITAGRATLAQTGGTSYWRRPVAPNSIAGLTRDLKSIFDAAVRNGRLASNPCNRLERAYHRTLDDHREG